MNPNMQKVDEAIQKAINRKTQEWYLGIQATVYKRAVEVNQANRNLQAAVAALETAKIDLEDFKNNPVLPDHVLAVTVESVKLEGK